MKPADTWVFSLDIEGLLSLWVRVCISARTTESSLKPGRRVGSTGLSLSPRTSGFSPHPECGLAPPHPPASWLCLWVAVFVWRLCSCGGLSCVCFHTLVCPILEGASCAPQFEVPYPRSPPCSAPVSSFQRGAQGQGITRSPLPSGEEPDHWAQQEWSSGQPKLE